MTRTSALGQFTSLPVLADAADITAVGTTMADQVEKFSNMRFASVAARDAAITSPAEGMQCITTDLGRKWLYSGSAWIFDGNYKSTGRPGVVLTSSSQAVGSGATVTTSWTTETQDVDGWITAPGTTLTVPTGWGGCYQATYRVVWSASTASPMESSLVVNGVLIGGAAGAAANAFRELSVAMRGLVPTDTIACSSFNGSAGSLNMTCVLVIDWVAP